MAIWYDMPHVVVIRIFTAILEAECGEVLDQSWNSERPLVFIHVVLTKTLGIQWSRDIRSVITRRMELWERGVNAGIVGDSDSEVAFGEERDSRDEEE